MKKTILTLAAIALSAVLSFGQSMKEATETAQAALEAYNAGNYDTALEGFRSALAVAETSGEEGQELVSQCKSAIPQILMSQAKKLAGDAKYDEAVAKLGEVIDTAQKLGGSDELAAEAKGLIPDILMSKGNDALKNEDYAGAADIFRQITELEPANGKAFFYLGQSLSRTGDLDGALAAFQGAGEAGYDKAAADKQIMTIKLKQTMALYKGGSLDAAVDGAVDLLANADGNASIVNGASGILQGCVQTAAIKNKKPEVAAGYYNKLEAVNPDNAKLGMMAYMIGAGYYQNKNNAQAKTWLTKALKDPAAAAKAKPILEAIK